MENNTPFTGISFLGLLTIAFIVLKLTNVINWSWLWVLAPAWVPLAVVVMISVVIVILALLKIKK